MTEAAEEPRPRGGAGPRRKGDRFERETFQYLLLRGFYVARSAGSLGPADIVALRSDLPPMLVSCKVGGRLDPGEWTDLYDTAADAGAVAVLAERRKVGTRAGVPHFAYLMHREKGRNSLRDVVWP